MTKRRILLVNDFACRGGAEEVYQATVRALAQIEGTTVDTFDGSLLGVAESFRARMWNRRAAELLQEKLQSFKPDLIWIHNFQNFLSPSILVPLRRYKQRSGARIMQTAHDYLPAFFTPDMMYFGAEQPQPVPVADIGSLRALFKPSSPKGRLHDIIKKAHWIAMQVFLSPRRVIDTYLCPSEFLLHTLQQAGITQAELFLNPAGDAAAVTQKSKPVGSGGLRLAFAGRLCYEKGIQEFLRMARQIDFEGIDAITLYGDGPLAGALREEFAPLIQAGKLTFAGRVPHADLPGLLRQQDAMVLPSVWYENAPMVIPEAAESGLPILVRDLGSMSSYGQSIGNKVLFASSPEGLRDALKLLARRLEQQPAPVFNLSQMTRQRYVENVRRLLSGQAGQRGMRVVNASKKLL